MKLGYPCINRSIECTANSTFRLASYSRERFLSTVQNNLDCLQEILEWNVEKGFLFFRIGSPLVPFASHPVCKIDWVKHFKKQLKSIGDYIKKHQMRISMHPDQFVLINAKDNKIVKNSFKELEYHCKLLDAMELDSTAKVMIHVGGMYGEKEKSIERFIQNYKKLPAFVKNRFVVENDDRSYSLKDCLKINKRTKIPIVFDKFHHECKNNGESVKKAMKLAQSTWKKKDGLLIVHYSDQKKNARIGTHSEHIDLKQFKKFIQETKNIDFDLMLEIKDKEKSALKAIEILKKLKYYK
ncbi:UV DNA damage repair endonuclease UvsE [Candidatus Woesearchaeota archaeon]|nr:UV DNA damage repair endonuclease UvsE [Candidatus Woesearchaeota archaeon]